MEVSHTRIKQLVAKYLAEYPSHEVFIKVIEAFINEFTSDAPQLDNLIVFVKETLDVEAGTAKSSILELLALVVKCIHHRISFNDEEFTVERVPFIKTFRETLTTLSRNSTFLSYIAQFDTYFARQLVSSDFQFEMDCRRQPQIDIRWRMKLDDGEEKEVLLSPAMIGKMLEETGAALQAIDSMKRRQQMGP